MQASSSHSHPFLSHLKIICHHVYWSHPCACRGGHMGATAGEKDRDDAIILTSKYENEEPFTLTLALMV